MVSEYFLDIQDRFWKVRCQLIIFIILGRLLIYLRNARGQRALARRNRRNAIEVPAAPREENPVESDTEESDILKKREQVPLRIRIQGARGRADPPAAEVPAAIDPKMWWNKVNVKPPHLSDLEEESMKKDNDKTSYLWLASVVWL